MEEKPYLNTLIEREFSEVGDIEMALNLVKDSDGIWRSRELAAYHAKLAGKQLDCLKPSAAKASLLALTDYVLSRLY
jgi:all-trans-nonaprenyl-diphosphate synthase